MTTEKWALQRIVAIAAIVPVAAGLYGVLFGLSGLGKGITDVSAETATSATSPAS